MDGVGEPARISAESTRARSANGSAAKVPPALAAVEEEFNRRLDAELESLDVNFGHIIRSAPLKHYSTDKFGFDRLYVKDKYKITQDHQLVDSAASNVVRSVEGLLSLTRELKESLILNDFKNLNRNVRTRWEVLSAQRDANSATLGEMKADLDVVIAELEKAAAHSHCNHVVDST
ncbi:surfeit locus protein 5 subunit 22 of mediator complex-domain-containing protein [Cladochytrium replicatum]|nr:surfeit locus protein 5 subunit 22 of mediator complex-domain-containing protein [Cladochytrium replicatum]